jgi:hypothetical protein
MSDPTQALSKLAPESMLAPAVETAVVDATDPSPKATGDLPDFLQII